jgi:RimJ/RimL family protein N-acetyltransferase
LLSDERVWGHFPSGRHSSLEETREWLVDSSGRWVTDRLGYWTARLQVPIDSLTTGTFAGVGGCAMSTRGNWWNLYYRLRPELHRRGLASELCQVALAAARAQPRLQCDRAGGGTTAGLARPG